MARILQQANTQPTARVLSNTQTQSTDEPNFLESIAGNIAKPFVRLGTNVENAYNEAKSIGDIHNQSAFDADQAKIQDLNQNGQNLPIVGNVKPVGQSGNAVQKLGDTLGTGAQIAATVLPIGEGASVGKATLGTALKQGARIGGATGALYNAGQELQNPDANINTIGGQALLGGITGAVGGAVLGPALAALTKTPIGILGVKAFMDGGDKWEAFTTKYPTAARQINAVANPKGALLGDETSQITDALTPKLTPTEFKAAGRAGQTSEPTLTKGSEVVGSKIPTVVKATQAVQDVASTLGKKATDVIKSGVGQVTGNINRVNSLIGEYSDKEVKPLLSQNKAPFNFEDLRDSLNLVQPSSGLKADPAALSTYSRIREEVLNTAASALRKIGKTDNATDFNDIWNVRKIVDSKIESELGETTFGTPQYTGVKAAARDMRQGLTQFIDESLRYPGQMEKVNRLNASLGTLKQKGVDVTEEMLPALKKQLGVAEDAKGTAVADAFKAHIAKIRSLYDAADHLETKIGTETKSKVGAFLKAHPVAKKLTGATLTGAGIGTGIEAAHLVE